MTYDLDMNPELIWDAIKQIKANSLTHVAGPSRVTQLGLNTQRHLMRLHQIHIQQFSLH
jgi:hypothetical protein